MSEMCEVNGILMHMEKSIKDSENYEDYVKKLLIICSGPQRKDVCQLFAKVLISEELIISLLNIRKCRTFLKDNPELPATIASTLFQLTVEPWDIIFSLFNCIPSNHFMKKKFIQSIWTKKDSLNMPSKLASIIIKEELSLIENHFLDIYNSNQDLRNVWNDSCNYCFVLWCCESHEIFHIVVSVLNQFLIFATSKNIVLKLIEYFILHFVSECEKHMKNAVHSYPLQYQSLVSLLVLEPEINPCREYAIYEIQQLLSTDPHMALLFLSHFPKWINVLDR